MLKILGRYNSLNTQKVLWLCAELDLAYQLDNHGMEHGKNDRPEYLALNPMGLVPTILDGDFVLWESNAILRYLGRKHSRGALTPPTPARSPWATAGWTGSSPISTRPSARSSAA